jgi:thiamine-phosphate pyrophosphorylase
MIYALLDFDTLKKYDISIKDFLKTAKGLKAKLVQYRDKNSSIEEKKERIKEIKKYWKKTLIVNDNVELLDLADGIHIGQEDLLELIEKFNLSAYEVVEFLKRDNKIVGLSTHNKEEILKANSLPLSYIGLGAYRRTSTKDTTNILGEKIIDLIKFSYHPVAVIGGVKIYDKIPANFKVIGSDICKLTSIRLKKKKIFKMKLKSL